MQAKQLVRFLWFFTLLMVAFCLTTLNLPKLIKKSSAVESLNVGVYWASGCTQEVTSIDWGQLSPGSKTEVDIFVRNEVNQPLFIAIATQDWNPTQTADYITLSGKYDRRAIDPEETVLIPLTLKVSEDIIEITDFSFNIHIIGTEYLIGDLDHDGDVDICDIRAFSVAYGSEPSDPNWNPLADFNGDNIINLYDAVLLTANYGVSSD